MFESSISILISKFLHTGLHPSTNAHLQPNSPTYYLFGGLSEEGQNISSAD